MQSQSSNVDVLDSPMNEPVDPHPNQESVLAERQREDRLRRAVGKLPEFEQLLVRMRFEQGLSLQEIADLTELGDAQRVHRRIAVILEKLRIEID